MQWMFIVKPTRPDMLTSGPTAEEMELAGRHFEYWRHQVSQGAALVVGRTQTSGPETVGIAIFEAVDEDAARAICTNDPAVEGRLFSMEVYPYQVALLGNCDRFKPKH